MLQTLSLPEFLALAGHAKRVIVYREFIADRCTPMGIVEALPEEMQDGVVLESAVRHRDSGRHSFIAFDSMAHLTVKDRVVTQCVGDVTTVSDLAPFDAMRKLMQELACVGKPDQSDFMGGIVGYMSYDAVRLFEAIPDRHTPDPLLADMAFNFYRTTLVFDHVEQKLIISTAVEIGNDAEAAYYAALKQIDHIAAKISHQALLINSQAASNKKTVAIETDIQDADFIKMVEKAKAYIKQGDAFQIVSSRSFTCAYSVTPLEIYRALRRTSPAPYMFYMPMQDRVLVGASPERLISVKNRRVNIHPIAGTRPINTLQPEKTTEAELLNDKKECAEHMMLVDLARNDLGAVCQPGTVNVDALLQVKHFSHVSHITSSVSGLLQPAYDAFDALAAAFPAGTLSGAPKIRAMEIIDELETSRRGMYGGVICRLDYQGNLDSCIAIRMAVLKDNIAMVRAGGEIVHDSDPLAEANETRQKAKTVLDAIVLAEAGL